MNVIRQMSKIVIIPGRMRVAVNAWRFVRAVPADAEPVAVGRLDIMRCAAALIDLRMVRTH